MPHGNTKLSEKDSQGNLLATWCEPDLTDPYKALCLVCNKRLSCSNSGNAQIIAHAKGAKHIVLKNNKKGQKVLGVVQSSKSCASSSSTSKATNTLVAFQDESLTEKICKAEILWTIKMCVEDWSFASSDGISDIFRTMFPGQISSGFSLSRTMATYLISDGLGPYFKKKLVEDINESGIYFTIQYDETTTQHNR